MPVCARIVGNHGCNRRSGARTGRSLRQCGGRYAHCASEQSSFFAAMHDDPYRTISVKNPLSLLNQ